MLSRYLYSTLVKSLQYKEITILYGARQVWKSTLLKKLLDEYPWSKVFYNCDLSRDRAALSHEDDILLKPLISPYELVIIDEAQRIPNIWLVLKIIHEYYPDTKVIASGSSSFDLANQINEPLTWRSYIHTLYPLSMSEIMPWLSSPTAIWSLLPSLLIYGQYPKVYTSIQDGEDPIKELSKLTDGYLYKDILAIDNIQKAQVFEKLLQLLALQCGKLVSYTELATKLEINRLTVQKYISILEQSFIIFTLPVYSSNTRKSIGKQQKVYFWDIWVRNALIYDFSPLEIRSDVGELFENLIIAERKKYCMYHDLPYKQYFWRNYAQAEVDLIEVTPLWNLYWYEIKLTHPKSPSRGFTNENPTAEIWCITQANMIEMISLEYD